MEVNESSIKNERSEKGWEKAYNVELWLAGNAQGY